MGAKMDESGSTRDEYGRTDGGGMGRSCHFSPREEAPSLPLISFFFATVPDDDDGVVGGREWGVIEGRG